jgi:2-keto-4-pentenoate hydratase/2-oxohepta-3-ene-1,7-dioic acid hydratase in catechol pathway
MRFATVVAGGTERVGVVRGDALMLLPQAFGDLIDIIQGGVSMLALVRALIEAGAAESIGLGGAQWLAPLRRFRRDLLCTGWNYLEHLTESRAVHGTSDRPIPEHPTFFTKGPDAVIGPYDDIAWDPALSGQWDHEAELAVVIGRDGRSIPEARAFEHVWGYCLCNDLSQRDLQYRHGGQWLKGKSIDATAPLGPVIVTADAIDPRAVQIECYVNGERRQSASTAQMAFPIERLIAELSFGMTLRAGDVLLTGTPSGVGYARKPPLLLTDGDEVVTRGSGIGELRNRLARRDLASYAA